MPELTLEIGGRLYEVACNPGQEKMLENAASLLDAEAQKIGDSSGTATEKRMLLLAGLMIGDNLTSLEKKLAEAEEQIHAAEERIRIAEAKSAMLATSALKRDTDANAGSENCIGEACCGSLVFPGPACILVLQHPPN